MGDHELLLHDLVKAFEIDDISREGCLSMFKNLLVRIKKYSEKYNFSEEIRMSDLVGQYKYFGCLLFVV